MGFTFTFKDALTFSRKLTTNRHQPCFYALEELLSTQTADSMLGLYFSLHPLNCDTRHVNLTLPLSLS